MSRSATRNNAQPASATPPTPFPASLNSLVIRDKTPPAELGGGGGGRRVRLVDGVGGSRGRTAPLPPSSRQTSLEAGSSPFVLYSAISHKKTIIDKYIYVLYIAVYMLYSIYIVRGELWLSFYTWKLCLTVYHPTPLSPFLFLLSESPLTNCHSYSLCVREERGR